MSTPYKTFYFGPHAIADSLQKANSVERFGFRTAASANHSRVGIRSDYRDGL